MISFLVRLRFDASDRQRVRDIFRELARASREEPGCVVYIPHFVEGDPDVVLIYEQYHDEAARDAHRGSEHFQRLAIGGFYPLMKQRAVEDLVAIV